MKPLFELPTNASYVADLRFRGVQARALGGQGGGGLAIVGGLGLPACRRVHSPSQRMPPCALRCFTPPPHTLTHTALRTPPPQVDPIAEVPGWPMVDERGRCLYSLIVASM